MSPSTGAEEFLQVLPTSHCLLLFQANVASFLPVSCYQLSLLLVVVVVVVVVCGVEHHLVARQQKCHLPRRPSLRVDTSMRRAVGVSPRVSSRLFIFVFYLFRPHIAAEVKTSRGVDANSVIASH